MQQCFPSFPDFLPHLVSAHGYAARLRIPLPLRRRECPRLYSLGRALAAVPLRRRRPHGIISGIPHHRKHGLRRRSVHVRRRCALAALVSSHHTFCRALRCNCRCSGAQPCIGTTFTSKPSLPRFHRLNWRCRYLPCLFQNFLDPHAPFHPFHRKHSPLL